MSANPNLKRLRIATPIAASTTRRESFIGTGGEGYTGFHQRLSIRDAVPTQPPGSRVEYSGKRQSAPDCTTVSCSLSLGISMTALDNKDRPTNTSNIFFRPFSCFIAFASTNRRECRRITTIFYSTLLSSRIIGETQTSRLHFRHHDYNFWSPHLQCTVLYTVTRSHVELHRHQSTAHGLPLHHRFNTCRTPPTSTTCQYRHSTSSNFADKLTIHVYFHGNVCMLRLHTTAHP